MRVLLTGGSGQVGAFVAPALAAAGHEVVHLARRPPAAGEWARWALGDAGPLPRAEALVHLAFAHVSGRYRGGEGEDAEGFLAANLGGSLALVAAARAGGVRRVVFLSSRAVYGDGRRGEALREDDALAPDSLYGAMKRDVEAAVLAAPGGVALRATGVYGLAPGAATHKWTGLFAEYLAGRPVAPRRATEVHGDDLAAAVVLMLARPAAEGAFNVSDLMVDRGDLLAAVQARTGAAGAPPGPDPGPAPGEMATERLRALGWRPGGAARLAGFLDALFGPPEEAAPPA
ncbi:NAD(P)-dependent oxidoreductase [Amaricoccus sp.]|uniref:NAD-dependent epimerase/dehydratase family protein n=1 Tax=Amaricoccus sp. TaxID=1872485 RepID=UPI001B64300B|nr:NAD(P)-dependent oxidoreductase [Amaricoccus sp.]MBP7000856.1 NAD(P)-dependent oxidoreductase [Amaricoccus sp.]